jgi:hypothetical protein
MLIRIVINHYRNVAVTFISLIAFSTLATAGGYTNSAWVEGYTIIDVGPYQTVRFETGSVRKVMPTVSSTSTNPVQAITSSSQTIVSSDPSETNAFTITSHFQYAGISGFAAAQAGSVHVWARDSAIAAPPAIMDPDGVPYLTSPYTVVASVTAVAMSQDTITFTSGTMTNGTPIQFTWNLYADAAPPQEHFGGDGGLPLGYQAGFSFNNNIQVFNQSYFSDCGGKRCLNGSLDVMVKVGDVIPVYVDVVALGTAFVDASDIFIDDPDHWSAWGVVNMANTAGMWLSNIPAGVQFASASGYDYTLPPQEPVVPTPDPFVLSARLLPGGSQIEISWNSQTNIYYQPQFQPVSDLHQWIDFGTPIVGNGSTNQFTDSIAPAQGVRLYRLIITP